MQYRNFGKTNWQASALGFGVMRLPSGDGRYGAAQIDEKESTAMIYHAIEQGVNYIDTAYPYHHGQSEHFLGKILQGGWREKVHLATKMPSWMVETREDFDRIFQEQLARLKTDHFDLYLLHALDKTHYQKLSELDVLDWAEKRQAEGRIGLLGFSFHDTYEVFQQIVDSYDKWDFCQIQYNYMNTAYQAGRRGLQYAAAKGMAVVVMEPLLGGKLARPNNDIQAIWERSPLKRSAVEWALHWIWNQPEVSVVLSGMSAMQQVGQNLAAASASCPGLLTADDMALVEQVRAQFSQSCPIPCTSCKYCQPCPNDVNIPAIFEMFNDGRMYGSIEDSRYWYNEIPAEERADQCEQCRQCEDACPQSITVVDWLALADEVLGKGKPYDEVLPRQGG